MIIEIKMDSEAFVTQIVEMRCKVDSGRKKPHRPLLLLSVLDLLDARQLNSNRISCNETLLDVFASNFRHYLSSGDWCQPSRPYFHLRSSGFWHHKVIEGREEAYRSLKTVGGGSKDVRKNIENAYFSEEVYNYLLDVGYRRKIRETLVHLLKT